MRILYGIQGTGNGHLTRALKIIPLLKKKAEVDVLLSGFQCDLELPFAVDYRFRGMSFIFGKKGGIDFRETYIENSLWNFTKEVKQIPVHRYDLVISDFEPLTAWACKLNKKKCIGLSNQAATLQKGVPKPKMVDPIGWAILKYYAPTRFNYGFHYQRYNPNIAFPVIRDEVKQLGTTNEDMVVVYLPAHEDEEVLKVLRHFPNQKWKVFSKHYQKPSTDTHISIEPVNGKRFLAALSRCKGVITASGFSTTAEALYLKKKLLVVPMKGQYEQKCNATALFDLGVEVMANFSLQESFKVKNWLQKPNPVTVAFEDETESLLDKILEEHYFSQDPFLHYISKKQFELNPTQ